jgi:hypothetical protein
MTEDQLAEFEKKYLAPNCNCDHCSDLKKGFILGKIEGLKEEKEKISKWYSGCSCDENIQDCSFCDVKWDLIRNITADLKFYEDKLNLSKLNCHFG